MARRSDKPQKVVPSSPPVDAHQWADRWACPLIFLATLLVYFPALSGQFVWDDLGHITRPELRSFTGLSRIWFEIGATQQYYPLLHSAFWFEHRLWGDAVLGYHLVNVLFHATAACIFGFLLRRLLVPGAWFAAFLFTLHPVCVESVAWISEQKNTLSLLLYLAAALAYLRFDDRRNLRNYVLASGLFWLALLTKTVTATLPAALLVISWWRRGRLDRRRDVFPLLPWLAVGAAAGLFTAHIERSLIGAQGTDFAMNVGERCLLAGRVFWFYLGKLTWPVDLSFNYSRWSINAGQVWQWSFPLGAVLLITVLIWRGRNRRGPLAALLIYAGSLFPVLGFFSVYPFLFSFVADHFAYLPSLAIFALIAGVLAPIASKWSRGMVFGAAALLLVPLGGLTWARSGIYRDVFVLYQDTLEKNPFSWLAHNNLALALADSGRVTEAVSHLETALKLRPDFAEAENNLGDDLTRLRRPKDAIPHLREALRLQPGYVEAHNNLGTALVADGRPAESIRHFETALRLAPANAEIQNNLGIALSLIGRTAEALPCFTRATELKPGYAQAELNLSLSLIMSNRYPDAVPHFEKAVALDPNPVETRKTYATTLLQAGKLPEAVAQYEQLLRFKPDDADAHRSLAIALRRLDRRQESTQHYLEAIRLNPDFATEK